VRTSARAPLSLSRKIAQELAPLGGANTLDETEKLAHGLVALLLIDDEPAVVTPESDSFPRPAGLPAASRPVAPRHPQSRLGRRTSRLLAVDARASEPVPRRRVYEARDETDRTNNQGKGGENGRAGGANNDSSASRSWLRSCAALGDLAGVPFLDLRAKP
jgi:hypothetical protein